MESLDGLGCDNIENHEPESQPNPDAEIEKPDSAGIAAALKHVQALLARDKNATATPQTSPVATASVLQDIVNKSASQPVTEASPRPQPVQHAPSPSPETTVAIDATPPPSKEQSPPSTQQNSTPAPPEAVPNRAQSVREHIEAEFTGEAEAPIQEVEDSTPPEKPGVEVAKSDGNKKAKTDKNDKSIDWGVGTDRIGVQARTTAQKLRLFLAIQAYSEEEKKWPNQTTMVKLAKTLGIKAQYSTFIDKIRDANQQALNRKKSLNEAGTELKSLQPEDPRREELESRVSRCKAELEKHMELDTAAQAVQDAKCGRAAAVVGKVREAATAAKQEARSLREKNAQHMMEEQKKVLDKNKAILDEKQEELTMLVSSKRHTFSPKMQGIFEKLENKVIEAAVIDLTDDGEEAITAPGEARANPAQEQGSSAVSPSLQTSVIHYTNPRV
eukprot:gene13149-15525_t